MMKRSLLVAGALAVAATTAQASDFDYLDIYFVPSSELDFGGGADDDGDGFGIKGKAHVADTVTLHGEYQATTLDDSDLDINQLRFGIGAHAADNGSGARLFGDLEYVDVEFDFPVGGSESQSGFGIHGGLLFSGESALSGFAKIGYLSLDDADGFEFNIGAIAKFNQQVAGFVDYRSASLEDDADDEADLSDFRLGIRILFGTH